MDQYKWDDDDLAYAAGFIDGEGCFYIDKNWKISISCSNTDKPIIEWLKRKFGGSICKNATRINKPNHRRVYSWQIVANQAALLLNAIVPYLKIKTEQALILLAIQQTKTNSRDGRRVKENIRLERIRLENRLRELKHVTWD